MLVGLGVVPAWMVALIVVREVLITGLRQAAIERGVVLAARDLGKLKTWAQAIAAAVGGFAAAGAWSNRVAWWTLLVARRPHAGCRGSTTRAARPRCSRGAPSPSSSVAGYAAFAPCESHHSSKRAQARRYSRNAYSPSSTSARTAQWQWPQ